jgi:glutamate synthase (NADPH/NADH) large chain
VDEIKGGANILIISDRNMSATQVAIPALLALSAIHQHLVREGLRTTAGLVVETGTAREVHHFAVLAGYGAEAVHPIWRWRPWSTSSAAKLRPSLPTRPSITM